MLNLSILNEIETTYDFDLTGTTGSKLNFQIDGMVDTYEVWWLSNSDVVKSWSGVTGETSSEVYCDGVTLKFNLTSNTTKTFTPGEQDVIVRTNSIIKKYKIGKLYHSYYLNGFN